MKNYGDVWNEDGKEKMEKKRWKSRRRGEIKRMVKDKGERDGMERGRGDYFRCFIETFQFEI